MPVHAQPAATELVAGLAVDDRFLRVLVLEARGGPLDGPRVVDAAEADLDERLVNGGAVLDNAALGRRIGDLWRALRLGGVPTYLGFHPLDTVVRTVGVGAWPDAGPPAEITAVVAAARADFADEPVWNVQPTHADRRAARIAVSHREHVSNVVWAARRSGVWVAGVELAGLALARGLQPVRQPAAVVVDRTGSGPATVLLLVRGSCVAAWRVAVESPAAPDGELTLLSVDRAEADRLGRRDRAEVASWLRERRVGGARPAAVLQPGHGLAADSPVPLPSFGTALGLALAAARLGAAAIDLQGSLLTSGVALLQARLASGGLRLTAPPPVAPSLVPPAAPPGGAPGGPTDGTATAAQTGGDTGTDHDPDPGSDPDPDVVPSGEPGAPDAGPGAPAATGATADGPPPAAEPEGSEHPSPGEPEVEPDPGGARSAAPAMLPLPRRRRRRVVAVVAGAAAVGAFLLARNAGNEPQVEPRSSEDGSSARTAPPVTVDAMGAITAGVLEALAGGRLTVGAADGERTAERRAG